MLHLLTQVADNGALVEAMRHVADGKPMPVKSEGVGLGSLPGWIMAFFTGGILATVLKFGLAWRKQSHDRGDMLDEERRGDMKGMRERIEKLEQQLDSVARDREIERLRHEAEMRVMRHRLNNSNQCLDALLLLLETNPEKVAQAVGAVKEMRARQRETEAIESAALHTEKLKEPEG